ncbi:MAG: nucleotidyltransferase domain-containing protein, partial [Lachnospiraceae bacterium]|nr:nucleotidyltransferase domain-containing protein [Lachnospiraceae bacterium]
VDQLLETKKQMAESEKNRRIDHLNTYIETQLAYYKNTIDAMDDDRTSDWDALNKIFLDMISF